MRSPESSTWSSRFKSPKPEWLDELYKQFRQYKILKKECLRKQEEKDYSQIPGDSFEKDLRKFNFKRLKKLCYKYIELVDKEVSMASKDRLEFEFDKKRKKMKYELYQIKQLMKLIKK